MVLQLSDAFLTVVDDFLVVEDALLLWGISSVGLGSEDSLDDIGVPLCHFWIVEPDGPRSDDMRAVVVVTVALIMGADVTAVWDEPEVLEPLLEAAEGILLLLALWPILEA